MFSSVLSILSGQCTLSPQQTAACTAILRCCCGVIYDSCPVDFTSETVSPCIYSRATCLYLSCSRLACTWMSFGLQLCCLPRHCVVKMHPESNRLRPAGVFVSYNLFQAFSAGQEVVGTCHVQKQQHKQQQLLYRSQKQHLLSKTRHQSCKQWW